MSNANLNNYYVTYIYNILICDNTNRIRVGQLGEYSSMILVYDACGYGGSRGESGLCVA